MDMHLILVIIFLIAAAAVVFWFLSKVSLPEPFNIVVYALLALLALLILGNLMGVWGSGGIHINSSSLSPVLDSIGNRTVV